MSTDSDGIEVELKIEEPRASINTAIPLGLIVAELFTNAVKYAFEPEQHGIIKISLTKAGARRRLVVSDNGRGLPEDVRINQAKSLGFQIVTALSSQLQATIRQESRDGTMISIDFPAE